MGKNHLLKEILEEKRGGHKGLSKVQIESLDGFKYDRYLILKGTKRG